MTLENHTYGPAWVKCARCGTTQPIATLVSNVCVDAARCGVWAAQNERERLEFERRHPVVKP